MIARACFLNMFFYVINTRYFKTCVNLFYTHIVLGDKLCWYYESTLLMRIKIFQTTYKDLLTSKMGLTYQRRQHVRYIFQYELSYFYYNEH